MAYEVHITRKQNWFDKEGPAITLEEWRKYAASDAEMRLDVVPEPATPQGTVRMESPGAALWAAYSKQGPRDAQWFRHFRDRVTVKDPDAEVIGKMCRIAAALGGKVQGNDGEVYAADGSSNRKAPRAAEAPAEEPKRGWWKFGR
jgi:hypothetical protein